MGGGGGGVFWAQHIIPWMLTLCSQLTGWKVSLDLVVPKQLLEAHKMKSPQVLATGSANHSKLAQQTTAKKLC